MVIRMKKLFMDLLLESPLIPLKGRFAVKLHSYFFHAISPLRGQGVRNNTFYEFQYLIK
jgi:hypothetical protein